MTGDFRPPVLPDWKTTVTLNIAVAASSGSVAVVFPAGRFSASPVVTATINGGTGASVFFGPNLSGLSPSGVTLNVFHRDGGTATASLSIGVSAGDPS